MKMMILEKERTRSNEGVSGKRKRKGLKDEKGGLKWKRRRRRKARRRENGMK